MKKIYLFGLIAVCITLIVGVYVCRSSHEENTSGDNGKQESNPSIPNLNYRKVDKPKGKNFTRSKKPIISVKERSIEESDTPEFSPEDQKTVDNIQSALDDENFVKVQKQIAAASASKNPEVRKKAIEALQWFGEKALAELTPFLADTDGEVRDSAMTAIEQALAQMENEAMKVSYIENVMMIGACTEDGMTMLSGELNGISDETLTVEAAVRVIKANTNQMAVETMKEVYEFATGEAYTTPEAAEQWVADKLAENGAENDVNSDNASNGENNAGGETEE